MEAVRALKITGVNVTVPHKEAVIPILTASTGSSGTRGAVNTIVNRDGVLTGYNTDGPGFIDALAEAGYTLREKVVILGAGGAAQAVAAALIDQGAAEIMLINRTLQKAAALADFRSPGVTDN